MAIIWRSQMSVGNSIIDDQHRYLICLMNTIEIALRDNKNKDILKTAIDQLFEYTEYHFIQEERIQQKIKFPKAAEHKQEHQRILKDLNSIKQQIDLLLGKDSSVDQDSSQAATDKEISDDELKQLLEEDEANIAELDMAELAKLMRLWVIDHVLGRDRDMKPYLSRLPSSFS